MDLKKTVEGWMPVCAHDYKWDLMLIEDYDLGQEDPSFPHTEMRLVCRQQIEAFKACNEEGPEIEPSDLTKLLMEIMK